MNTLAVTRRVLGAIVPVIAGLALCMQSASATHLADHRYTVWGEIRYEDNTPAANLTIKLLIGDGASLGEVKSDAQGRYQIVLHVHDDDVYKVFDMRVNNLTRKVRLLFNPNDKKTERGQKIDLIVKREGEY